MLGQLRKHASSWLVKVVLTTIILTFIFFFGYTEFMNSQRQGQQFIALVGSDGIPRRKFEAYFQDSLEKMRGDMGGTLPETMERFLRENVLHQLVTRELAAQYATQMGLRVSDGEVAEAIRSDKGLFPNGNADLTAYEERFRPYYRQKYGEDFEAVVERDLLIDRFQSLATNLFSGWNRELERSLKEKKSTAATPSPFEVLSLWIDGFKETKKIEIFD